MKGADLRKRVKALRKQGCEVVLTRNSHYRVIGPDGRVVSHFPSTPSDHRGAKNQRAELRRAGFEVPC